MPRLTPLANSVKNEGSALLEIQHELVTPRLL
jgi:hypothetical protein